MKLHLINKKNKKSQSGDVLMALFFLILVLIVVFIFVQFNTVILETNFQVNKVSIEKETLFNVKEYLMRCYSYPLDKITGSETCEILNNIDYKVEILDNGLCEKATFVENGIEKERYLTLLMPVVESETKYDCLGLLTVYFD